MQLAVTASSLSTDPRSVADLARKMGFSGLLFDASSAGIDLMRMSISGLREFRHVVTRGDIALVGLQAELGPRGFGRGADVDRLLSQCALLFDASRKLHVSVVCLEVGALPPPPPALPVRRPTQDEAGIILIPTPDATAAPPEPQAPPSPADLAMQSQVDSAMVELGRLADQYAVNLALRSDLASLAALERTLLAARCPWFGVDLNPAAVLSDQWSMHEFFSRLGEMVRHVRARDAVGGAGHRTKPMPVGLGDTKWDELLDDLSATDYRGWITADPVDLLDRPAAAIKAKSYLRLHER